MLFLAMSTFQGRTQDAAFDGVARHSQCGIQLTPGNLPSPGFRSRIAAFPRPIRRHHGFSFDAYRAPVYDAEGKPRWSDPDRSIHPPRSDRPTAHPRPSRKSFSLSHWLPIATEHDLLVETMMPGYLLGGGTELEAAMEARLRLALDISHIHIQRCQGVLDRDTERRLFAYDRIEEVHVSDNDGRRDQHRPIHPGTPYLDWARERMEDLPVVLESYWHQVPLADQRRQIELLEQPPRRKQPAATSSVDATAG